MTSTHQKTNGAAFNLAKAITQLCKARPDKEAAATHIVHALSWIHPSAAAAASDAIRKEEDEALLR